LRLNLFRGLSGSWSIGSNDAQKAIAKYIPFACSRVDAIKLKPGTKQSIDVIAAADVKPGDGSVAADQVFGNFLNDIVRNMGADGLTPGRTISVIARDMMDSSNPNWHSAATKNRVDEYTFDIRTPNRVLRITADRRHGGMGRSLLHGGPGTDSEYRYRYCTTVRQGRRQRGNHHDR